MLLNKKIVTLLSTLLSLSLLADDMYIQERLDDGKEIYKATCASCHGEKGETNPNIYLIVKPRKLNKTILNQEQSFKIIKEGARYWGAHSDMMPTFKYVYSDEEISNVALYISKEFNPDVDKKVIKLLAESGSISKDKEPKMLSVGAKIFKKNCSMCHGKSGNGESEYVEESKASKNFIFPYNLTRTLLSKEQIFLYAKFGGYFWGADKEHMPAWKKKYNDFELKSVSKYINEKIKKKN